MPRQECAFHFTIGEWQMANVLNNKKFIHLKSRKSLGSNRWNNITLLRYDPDLWPTIPVQITVPSIHQFLYIKQPNIPDSVAAHSRIHIPRYRSYITHTFNMSVLFQSGCTELVWVCVCVCVVPRFVGCVGPNKMGNLYTQIYHVSIISTYQNASWMEREEER